MQTVFLSRMLVNICFCESGIIREKKKQKQIGGTFTVYFLGVIAL